MRQIRPMVGFIFCASALSSAELWTGQLLDANCAEQHKEVQKYENCIPAANTASFTLQISGRMLRLDVAGNRKAAAAWKEYIDKPRVVDPDVRTKPVTAVVEGTVNGDEITVDSILLR
jgi:hypothetical protein